MKLKHTLVGLLTGAVLVSCQSGTATTSAGRAPFAGHRWRVVQIQHAGVAIAIPATMRTMITFADGELRADDGVNVHSGRYSLAATGYRTGDIAVTAAGYVGRDPVVLGSMNGITAITPYRGTVAARIDGGELILSAGDYTLRLRNAGSAG